MSGLQAQDIQETKVSVIPVWQGNITDISRAVSTKLEPVLIFLHFYKKIFFGGGVHVAVLPWAQNSLATAQLTLPLSHTTHTHLLACHYDILGGQVKLRSHQERLKLCIWQLPEIQP